MIQKIFISNEENYSDLLQSMDKVRNVLLMQFGIDLDAVITFLKKNKVNLLDENIIEIMLINLRILCKDIIDAFYFYNPESLHTKNNPNDIQYYSAEDSMETYNNALIISTYSTLCHLLEYNELTSLDSVRKKY